MQDKWHGPGLWHFNLAGFLFWLWSLVKQKWGLQGILIESFVYKHEGTWINTLNPILTISQGLSLVPGPALFQSCNLALVCFATFHFPKFSQTLRGEEDFELRLVIQNSLPDNILPGINDDLSFMGAD